MAVLLDWLAQVEVGHLDEGGNGDSRGKRRRTSIDIEQLSAIVDRILKNCARSPREWFFVGEEPGQQAAFIFRRGLDNRLKTGVSRV